MITNEMIEAFYGKVEVQQTGTILGIEAGLAAALALIPGEPVAILAKRDVELFDVNDTQIVAATLFPKGTLRPENEFPVFASPAPLPMAVKVKPLGWVSIGEVIFASTPFGSYEIRPNRTSSTTYPLELVVPGEKTATRFFYFEDKAKAAAQADYESRIRSALSSLSSPAEATDDDVDKCPICAEAFKPDDTCATDIELGICHAACLEGAPTVDLDTGDMIDGPIPTYPYSEVAPKAAVTCQARPYGNGAGDPQDCNWPMCGCDPLANKVITALEESGIAISDIAGLREENERLREALKPFSEAARNFTFAIAPDGIDDGIAVIAYAHGRREYEAVLTTADFSRAADVRSNDPCFSITAAIKADRDREQSDRSALQPVAKGERG